MAYRGQRHNEKLKRYFIRTEAQGSYLVAKLYTEYIASLAEHGWISVPERYYRPDSRIVRKQYHCHKDNV